MGKRKKEKGKRSVSEKGEKEERKKWVGPNY
jgi:hypothetical protein